MGSGTAGAGSGGGVTSGVPLSGSGLHVGAGDVSPYFFDIWGQCFD